MTAVLEAPFVQHCSIVVGFRFAGSLSLSLSLPFWRWIRVDFALMGELHVCI